MNDLGTGKYAVVIVAAGSGERLGFGMPKAKVPLGGEPMLVHAIRGALKSGVPDQICVALPRGDVELRSICETLTVEMAGSNGPALELVNGGDSRSESVRAALDAVRGDITAVLIHDAARPLAPAEVYERITAALANGAKAVIPALAVVDTIKNVEPAQLGDSGLRVERVQGTPARSQLRAIQTPQGFDLPTLRRAHEFAATLDAEAAAEITDDAMLVEAIGEDVFVVQGSSHSLKITTPTDLLLAEALLQGPLAPRWVEG
jgi:2-C-methyl-D-erythritol 4-phosphate cytidylyltransferase